MYMHAITVPSYAKLNLGLFILGVRDDGFHEIETILQQIDLNDEIEVKLTDSSKIEFSCDHPDLQEANSNLCVRAANFLKQTTGIQKGAQIYLSKTIPMGAGLGGGSSNAAVVLLCLNKLWGLNLSAQELQEIASQLGSDIPFFILGGTAVATGRGNLLRPAKLTGEPTIVVVFPKISVSTKWAYKQVNLSLTIREKNIILASFNDINYSNADFVKSLKNEFEEIVFTEYPLLEQIKKQINQSKAIYTSMSGSGSAIFGIFEKEEDALEVKRFFQNEYPTFVTRPINWGYQGVENKF